MTFHLFVWVVCTLIFCFNLFSQVFTFKCSYLLLIVLFCNRYIHRWYVICLKAYWNGPVKHRHMLLESCFRSCTCAWPFLNIDVGSLLSTTPIFVMWSIFVIPSACFLYGNCNPGWWICFQRNYWLLMSSLIVWIF